MKLPLEIRSAMHQCQASEIPEEENGPSSVRTVLREET